MWCGGLLRTGQSQYLTIEHKFLCTRERNAFVGSMPSFYLYIKLGFEYSWGGWLSSIFGVSLIWRFCCTFVSIAAVVLHEFKVSSDGIT